MPAESDAAEGYPAESDGAQSDGAESDAAQSDGAEGDAAKSDGAESDGVESDGADQEKMTIWVDADAAPRDVKEIVFRAAKRLEIRAVLVANQRLSTPLNNPHVDAVVVRGGPDVADSHIAEHASEGDIAVTADIPLAAILVEKGLVVLDPRGEEYTHQNVGERLSVRDFMASLRDVGVETGGPKPYGSADKRAFANALDRTLTSILGGSGA